MAQTEAVQNAIEPFWTGPPSTTVEVAPAPLPRRTLDPLIARFAQAQDARLRHLRQVTSWLESGETTSTLLWAAPEQGAATLAHLGATVAGLEREMALLAALLGSDIAEVDDAASHDARSAKGASFCSTLQIRKALEVIALKGEVPADGVNLRSEAGSIRASIAAGGLAREASDLVEAVRLGQFDALPLDLALAFAVLWQSTAARGGSIQVSAAAGLNVSVHVPPE